MAIRPSRMSLALLLVLWCHAACGLTWVVASSVSSSTYSGFRLDTLPGVWREHPWSVVPGVVVMLLGAAMLGGAIVRSAAVEATGHEPISPPQALRFAAQHWFTFFFTPVLPLLVVAVLGVVLLSGLSGGLLLRLPWVQIVGAVLFGGVLLVGVLLTLILIALVAGAALIYPAVAIDRADALDALSRAYNYALGRPWQLLFYGLVAAVYGILTLGFLTVVAALTLAIVRGFVSSGLAVTGFPHPERVLAGLRLAGPAPVMESEPNVSASVTAVIVGIWVYLFKALLPSYAFSFLLCSQTQMYLLLRRHADGTELDELFEPEATSGDEGDPST